MRITILANQDLASCLALNYLLPSLSEHRLNVFLSAAVGGKQGSNRPQQLLDLKFLEQQLYNELLFPLIDNNPTNSAAELKTFNGLSGMTQQPISELNDINQGAGLARFVATEPELVLSIRYGTILKDQAIAAPRLGVLNLHSGKLPDYRGVMASFWALLNGEETLGTTLHYISDAAIDAGAIVGATELPVSREHSYLWHVLALYADGCRLMLDAVATLAAGKILTSVPQAAGGNYYSFPSNEDMKKFESMGLRLFEPRDSMEIARRFMAPGLIV